MLIPILIIAATALIVFVLFGAYKAAKAAFGRFDNPLPDEAMPHRFKGFENEYRQARHFLKAHRHQMKTLTLTSEDGLKLQATYLRHPEAQRVYVFAHGYHSTPVWDVMMALRFYYESGCSVLMFDQRAHNGSEGRFISYGVLERKDMAAWVRLAADMPENRDLPIYLGGVSMGAATAIQTLEEDLPDNVCGVIADCSFSSMPRQLVDCFRRLYHIPVFPYYGLSLMWLKFLGHVSIKTACPEDVLARNDRYPVLFIHGTHDRLVMPSHAVRNYMACQAPTMICFIDGADHCQAYEKDPEKYESYVTSFFAFFEEEEDDHANTFR
ncbi:MAG: alpha/beta hydrolase [Lachnospiraceae bacterium]|nr:alpha/beta hydrolase [Lachnospiraceae bacterium]